MARSSRARACLALCLAGLAAGGVEAAPELARAPPIAPGDRSPARRASLDACLAGTRRPECRYDLLSPAERETVRAAESRQNLLLCLAGTYPAACRHELLSPAEARDVALAEAAAPRTGDPFAIVAPLPSGARAPLAAPRPDDHGPAVAPRWPQGATDPGAMYGTPFRRDRPTGPSATGGPAVLAPP